MVLAPTAYTTPYLTPLTRSATGGIAALAGASLSVTSFTTSAAPTPIPPGTPARLVVAATGDMAGTLAVSAGGAFTFTPAVGFVGAMPEVHVLVARSDGQSRAVPLNVTVMAPAGGVQPRKTANRHAVNGFLTPLPIMPYRSEYQSGCVQVVDVCRV